MTEITISNKRLNLENSNNYILSIRVFPDGFLFSILDHFSNTYLFFKTFHVPTHLQVEKLETLLSKEDFLQTSFYRVIIESCHAHSTLMPAALFDANKANIYFEFDNELNANHQVVYNNVSLLQIVNIFSIDKSLVELLESKFGKVEILHQHTTLLDKSITDKQKSDEFKYQITLQIHKGWFDLMLLKGDDLLLLNAYEFTGINDVLYFVLNALKQFKVAPVDTLLRLSGEEATDFEAILSDYIGKVEKVERTQRAEFAPEFFTIPAHQFSNFFYTPFCEL